MQLPHDDEPQAVRGDCAMPCDVAPRHVHAWLGDDGVVSPVLEPLKPAHVLNSLSAV
ncbi:MAG TPA: hypothetical protein VGC73_06860 [Pyrinomonadaceae bacterium]